MFFLLLLLGTCVGGLPVVDKGVFVITGVKTCGVEGSGYCILGGDCSVDKEFEGDREGGHCDGLRKAFTPRAFFVCCRVVNETTTTTTTTQRTINSIESVESNESLSKETSEEAMTTEPFMTTETMTTTPPTTLTPTPTPPPPISSCLQSLPTPRLSADPASTTCYTAALTRSPHSTQLSNDAGSFLCTGALVTPTVLITTATCVSRLFGQDLSQFKVVLGSKKVIHPNNGETRDGFYRDVEELVVHEEYGVSKGMVRVNDVALVKLSPPSINETVCTVCLPEPEEIFHGNCIVSGFSHPTTNGGESSDGVLHEAPQTLETLETCSQALEKYSNQKRNIFHGDNNSLICASGEVGREACFSPRDAGSPLVCPVAGGYKLVGIFSSGFHCGTREVPVLYTEVARFLGWVRGRIH